MVRGTMSGIPRPGTRVVVPAAGERSRRPWAVGYVSALGPVEPGTWTHWHAEVEAHALQQGLPMLHVYSDEHAELQAATAGREAPVSAGSRARVEVVDGLARMVSAIRELADLRLGHVSVVIVPSLDHLSPARDGSEQTVAMLLSLHLGVTVQPIDHLESARSSDGFTEQADPPPLAASTPVVSSAQEPLEGMLLPPGPGRCRGDGEEGGVDAGQSAARPRQPGLRAGLTFGDLLHGIHGDPDRVPVRLPSRSPAGPC